MVLACIICFNSCRTTFNPSFLTLYLCSITLYSSFLLISPSFFHSKMLICFRNSCIDCCILLFRQGFPPAFPLLWFGLRPTIPPTILVDGLNNLLVSVILSDLINFFQKGSYFHDPALE